MLCSFELPNEIRKVVGLDGDAGNTSLWWNYQQAMSNLHNMDEESWIYLAKCPWKDINETLKRKSDNGNQKMEAWTRTLTPSHPITFLVMFLAVKKHLKMLKTDSYQIRLTPMLKLTKKSHHWSHFTVTMFT